MKYSQMLAYVQKIGHFVSEEEAERALLAVSAVLAARISPEGAQKMASQMPKDVASVMSAVSEHDTFALQEFFNRIAGKVGVDQAKAMHHAEVVLGVLQDAMPTEILEVVFSGLDPEYRKFLNASALLGKREGLSLARAAFRL